MMQKNPYDQFDGPTVPAGLPRGSVMIAPPPAANVYDAPQAAATLARTRQQIDMDQATAGFERRRKAAEASAAEANAKIAQGKAAEAGVGARAIDPKLDRLTGADYLSQLPAQTQAQVHALSEGRMAFPSGAALRSPYWQEMLQHVAHYDPNFDAVNYNARAATRRDFVAGKSAQNIRALNTAIGHLNQLSEQIGGTASHGGLPGATLVNRAENALRESAGDPGITNFNQTAGALASELTQVFRGSGGAEADIQREIEHLTPNASAAQKNASVRNIAGLLKSRLDAIGDQYTQGMGTTAQPLTLLNPHAQQAYNALSGYDPGGTGNGGGGSGGGGGNGGGPVGPTLQAPTINNIADLASGLSGGKYQFDDQGSLTYNGKPVDVSAEVANSGAYRSAYQKRFGEPAPIAVDVVGGRMTPQARTQLEQRRDTIGGGLDAAVRGAADMSSLGVADPLAALARSAFNDDGFAANLTRERAISSADERVNPYWRLGGQIAGVVPSMTGLARAGAALTPARPFLGTALADTAGGAVYGGMSNMESNPVAGALVGGGAALIGNQIGQRLVAPAIEKVLARGASISPVARALATSTTSEDVTAARSAIVDAQRLDLPFSLADSSSKLRTLAGSATRLSPVARELAERVVEPRGRGQAERAIAAIQRDFGPTVNIDETADALINQGRSAAGSLYDEAYAAPIVSTPELEAVLATPAGRQALGRAHTIAANERRDPAGLGFALDGEGNVVLNPVKLDPYQAQAEAKSAFDQAQEAHKAALRTSGQNTETTRQSLLAARDEMQAADAALAGSSTPGVAATSHGYTTQTLDYVKRGLDDILEQSRDPVTRRLHLDEAGRAVNDVRSSLVREMDNLNPRYADARAAYEGPAKEREALLAGRGAVGPQTTPDRMNRMIAGRTDGQVDQFRSGFRTGMAEQVDRMRLSGNPYDAIHGTPDQLAKVGTLFPEGAENFARQAELERQMAKTQYETLGGSPTAGRRAADETLGPGLGMQLAGESALGMVTGAPPIGALTTAARATLRDRRLLGLGGTKRANDIAELLLNPVPSDALSTVDQITIARILAAQARAAGGSVGAAAALPLVGVE